MLPFNIIFGAVVIALSVFIYQALGHEEWVQGKNYGGQFLWCQWGHCINQTKSYN